MAHVAMLDKELQQYPRIKKFFKRRSAVDRLRSLSKWTRDVNVPQGNKEYFFSNSINYQLIDLVLISELEKIN